MTFTRQSRKPDNNGLSDGNCQIFSGFKTLYKKWPSPSSKSIHDNRKSTRKNQESD